MKTTPAFLMAAALALGLPAAHAQQSTKPAAPATSKAEAQADAKRLKQLNACNKKAKGKVDAAYQEAMAECMKQGG